MIQKRYTILVVALLIAGSLNVPTAGFSSASVDRKISVATASDDDAYLGIKRECRNNASRVIITNRFSSGTSLDIDIVVNGTARTIDDLSAGSREIENFDTFNTSDTMTIDASGSGIAVHLTRSLPRGC
jgi:hypothetical protein